ncbi:HupE/UreJ family protein [Roseimaritima sediminicola]|uniref:HupE/UreJ family protein n=1 Tax=Roseimaritima sediminicola TaxID=2662066 RepID=UPI001298424E|nr:HupE/UreJ family protein [Roseimaritima sediminicola]
MLPRQPLLLAFAALAGFPAVVFAHPGHESGHGLYDSVLHPLSGLDHLLAIVVISLLAVQIGGRAVWAGPMAYLVALATGTFAAAGGLAFGGVEAVAAASLLVAGAVLLSGRGGSAALFALLPCIGFVHGVAHTAALGTQAVFSDGLWGMLIGSTLLCVATAGAGMMFSRFGQTNLLSYVCRAAGTVATIAAVLLLVA